MTDPSTAALGPATNRVTPLGEVVAAPGRGAWMGNRGVLHRGDGSREVLRHHRGRAWITCLLEFRGRSVPQWRPGRYTPLFFLDEAVALAAGHRPCAECRRAAYNEFRSAWGEFVGDGSTVRAPELDAVLHRERLLPDSRGRRLHDTDWSALPDGAFVLLPQGPAVVVADHLTTWQRDNTYGARLARPRRGPASVITPPTVLGVLSAGYPVQVDDAAR